MRQARSGRLVFFEPWSLGDVIIAASALRELSGPAAIACHPRWHSIIRGALLERPELDLIPVALPYTTRNRIHAFDAAGTSTEPGEGEGDLVLSIRGDPRDYAAARKIFRKARTQMTGWVRFLGRKSVFVNAPYALGFLPTQNRYRSWASIAGVSFLQVEQTYRRLQADSPTSGRVAIHFGAQWRSKQFPQVAPLRDQLQTLGWEVVLLGGLSDPLPPGVNEETVTRVVDLDLIAQLRSAEHVITNDSGPMHLAAFLGCRTTALVRSSPIEEWLPPATNIVASESTPSGYRPHRRYMSDEILSDWPPIRRILDSLGKRATDLRSPEDRRAGSSH